MAQRKGNEECCKALDEYPADSQSLTSEEQQGPVPEHTATAYNTTGNLCISDASSSKHVAAVSVKRQLCFSNSQRFLRVLN